MTGAKKKVTVKRIRLPYPHAGQQAVLREAKRFNWLSAGKRWRKTTLGVAIATEKCLKGLTGVWGAPTYKQTLIAWDEFERAVGDVVQFKKGDQEINFPTGGKLFMRSLDDPNNARGYTADFVVLDEAGYIHEDAYYQVIRQMLIDTGGDLWALGTPRGRNWFWREHRNAEDREDSMAWEIPTKGCVIRGNNLERKEHPYENPDIPYEEIVNIYNTTPHDLFRQEVLAEFVKFGGSVFRNIEPNLYTPNGRDHAGHMLIMSIDWAKHNDYTVACLGCGDCKEELVLDRFQQIDYTFQRDRIKALFDRWQPEVVLAEMNALGEPNVELLWEDGLPVSTWTMSGSNKPGLIRGLATALEREEWKWIADKAATFEMEAFEQKTNPSTGRSTYSAPRGTNDDTVIARALLVHAEANMGHVPVMVT